MAYCTLCRCKATETRFGFRVCGYHYSCGVYAAPCPTCYPNEISPCAGCGRLYFHEESCPNFDVSAAEES